MSNKVNKSMFLRMRGIALLLIIALLAASVIRLGDVMIIHGKKYQSLASEQQLYDTVVSAPRGDIYDTNNNKLATSTTAWTVFITPNGIRNIDDSSKKELVRNTIADGLSELLGVEREKVYDSTDKQSYYVIVKKKADKETTDKVRKFLEDNKTLELSKYIGFDESTKRYYPNDSLASVVLGFVGNDDQGLSGIESYYDNVLTGVAGRVVAAKTAKGTNMPLTYETVEEAKQGNSLVLTIDSYIQYVAEKELEQAVEINKCDERGVCVIMNVKTGAILGLAIKGDFDPNDPFSLSAADMRIVNSITDEDEKNEKVNELRSKQWRNKAVSDAYEPGSVFKIITAAIGLEENITSLDSKYSCGYTTYVAGQPYHCHKAGGHGTQTLVEAMSNSCNPAFIALGQLIGVKTFSKYFEAFGLTSSTGIDLPGEGSSIYYTADKMGPTELASASFGQTFKITPIQFLAAASTAVNGGNLIQPHIVKQVLDADKNIIQTAETGYKRQVVSSSTSEKIRQMLEYNVNGGGCKNAYVPGYRTGGKTGTSQKVAEMLQRNQKGLYIGSYMGFAPIDNPEIAILVLLDEPKGESYYGGTISAPVASRILSQVLPYMGYEAKYTEKELKKLAISVPDVTGKPVSEAKGKITTAGLVYKTIGDGETVVSQLPSSSESLSSGGMVILYTDSNSESADVSVPNFTGMKPGEANTVAADSGINIEFSGNTRTDASKAYTQSIEAGTSVKYGTVITVYFRDDNDVTDISED